MGINIFSYYSKSNIINSPFKLAASKLRIENKPAGLLTEAPLVNVKMYLESFFIAAFCWLIDPKLINLSPAYAKLVVLLPVSKLTSSKVNLVWSNTNLNWDAINSSEPNVSSTINLSSSILLVTATLAVPTPVLFSVEVDLVTVGLGEGDSVDSGCAEL